MRDYTKSGLLLIIIGIGLTILEEFFSFLTAGLINLSFSGLITLVGIILMVLGRKEFGERHQKFVITAAILFLISFIITIIFVAYILFNVYSAVSYSTLDNLDLSFIKNIFLIVPITAVLGGLVNVFLVYELEDSNGVKILLAAFFVSILISIYVLVSGMSAVEGWTNDVQNALGNPNLLSSSNVEKLTEGLKAKLSQTGVFSIFSNLLFLVAYLIPYKRIKSGKLVPALPSYLKRCMNCGRPVPADSRVCAYCGKSFNEIR